MRLIAMTSGVPGFQFRCSPLFRLGASCNTLASGWECTALLWLAACYSATVEACIQSQRCHKVAIRLTLSGPYIPFADSLLVRRY